MTELITPPAKATFRAMSEGTLEDWQIIRSVESDVPLSESILEQLRRIGEVPCGFAVDRTTHSLQTATRAERAGRVRRLRARRGAARHRRHPGSGQPL